MTTIAGTATLAYGFTMAEIDDMAHQAVRVRSSGLVDAEEALALAWHAVVEELYGAQTEPSRYQLVGAALNELGRESDRMRSHYGLSDRGNSAYRGDGEVGPNFSKYWTSYRDDSDGFSDRLTDRLALPAVLSVLTPKQYEAISTLAAFDGDRRAAADALGLNFHAYESRISAGRRRLLALWFEHETPRRKKVVEGMCRAGHSRAEHSVRDSYGRWKCMTCSKGYSRRASRRYRARDRAIAAQDGSDLGAPA